MRVTIRFVGLNAHVTCPKDEDLYQRLSCYGRFDKHGGYWRVPRLKVRRLAEELGAAGFAVVVERAA